MRDRSKLITPKRYQVNIVEIRIPETYKEALKGPHSIEWSEVIEEKLKVHEKYGTWTLMSRKLPRALIKLKWFFKTVKNANNNTPRCKARLYAKGFQQQERMDYIETFAPVMHYDSMRALLALVALGDRVIVSFDVRSAFLNTAEKI